MTISQNERIHKFLGEPILKGLSGRNRCTKAGKRNRWSILGAYALTLRIDRAHLRVRLAKSCLDHVLGSVPTQAQSLHTSHEVQRFAYFFACIAFATRGGDIGSSYNLTPVA